MSWGIDFTADIYLSKQSYRTVMEVKDRIDVLMREVQDYETTIKMYISANPKDIVAEEWKDDPIVWLKNQVDELFISIHENEVEIYKLGLYAEFLEQPKDML